jgi:hypothetical protein
MFQSLTVAGNCRLAKTQVANQAVEYCTGLDVPSLTHEDTRLPFPDISGPTNLRTLPPPEHQVPYSGHQSKLLSEAFTESSCHPNPALRSLLDCILHSRFIANQEAEPTLTDATIVSTFWHRSLLCHNVRSSTSAPRNGICSPFSSINHTAVA